MLHSIYALLDPLTLGVRYIGVTQISLKERLAQHIRGAKRGCDTHKDRWIRTLLEDGNTPILCSVLTTEDRNDEVEVIRYFKEDRGLDLTNTTLGGPGCIGLPEKIRQACLKRSIETNRKRVRVCTPEQRLKIGAASKGRIKSPETIEKLRLSSTGRVMSDSTKEKMRAVKLGHPVSQATRDILSAKIKALPKRRKKEACTHGHPYTEENTRINVRGAQECRQCGRDNYARRIK